VQQRRALAARTIEIAGCEMRACALETGGARLRRAHCDPASASGARASSART
jgi:hypothetical protein